MSQKLATDTKGLLLPKFLTKEIAKRAVDNVLEFVFTAFPEFKRNVCHVVILVPGMKDDRESDYPDWPDYPLIPVLLYEDGRGDKETWEYGFDNIAKCKALQLWTDRNDDRTGIIPHLLFSGDAPYWGGVKRRGIVVTCSGIQPHFDKMVSGMVADMIVALSHEAWLTSDDCKEEVVWLT